MKSAYHVYHAAPYLSHTFFGMKCFFELQQILVCNQPNYRDIFIDFDVENRIFNTKLLDLNVKVKDSRNRPGVAQRLPGGLGSQISITFGT